MKEAVNKLTPLSVMELGRAVLQWGKSWCPHKPKQGFLRVEYHWSKGMVLSFIWTFNCEIMDLHAAIRNDMDRGSWGLSRLRVQLRLRSRSHGSLVRAPHWALCWQLGAWSLLLFLCLRLSLPLLSLSVSLSLSKINKH